MLRGEPYRLFFPVGLLLAAAGVLPWILFARGLTPTWPGLAHALVMSQGFELAVAIGFLGTMGPRRTRTAPLAPLTLALLLGGVVASAAALLAGATAAGEVLHLAVLGGLAAAAGRRAARGIAVPPSFVLVPIGAALAAAGALLLLFAPELALGRTLAAQGLMLALVLAVAPILMPAMLGVEPGWRVPHLAVGLGLAASFAVEAWLSQRAGLVLRGGLCAFALAGAGALAPSARPGLHRLLFRAALLLVPLGLLAAAVAPERRVALLHLTYAGGFAGLIAAVSAHVTLFHAGLARLADRWPALLVVTAAALGGAVVVRTLLEGFGDRYLDAMTLAAALWIAAVIAWITFLLPHLRRRPS